MRDVGIRNRINAELRRGPGCGGEAEFYIRKRRERRKAEELRRQSYEGPTGTGGANGAADEDVRAPDRLLQSKRTGGGLRPSLN